MIQFFGIGLLSGVTIGMLGIGAGVIMIPLLINAGLTIKQAVAIGLVLQAVPQSLPGVIMHWRNKTLPLLESVWVVVGSMLGIIIGTYILTSKWITDDRYLYAALAVLMICIAIYLMVKHVFV
jgi:hypothetical protein